MRNASSATRTGALPCLLKMPRFHVTQGPCIGKPAGEGPTKTTRPIQARCRTVDVTRFSQPLSPGECKAVKKAYSVWRSFHQLTTSSPHSHGTGLTVLASLQFKHNAEILFVLLNLRFRPTCFSHFLWAKSVCLIPSCVCGGIKRKHVFQQP